MSIFKRVTKRMIGKELQFDNLSNIIKTHDDEDAVDISTKRSTNELSLFSKENIREVSGKSQKGGKLSVASPTKRSSNSKDMKENQDDVSYSSPLDSFAVGEFSESMDKEQSNEKDSAYSKDDDASTLTDAQSYAETRSPEVAEEKASGRSSKDDRFETSRSTSIMTDGSSIAKRDRGLDIRTVPSIDSVPEEFAASAEDDYTEIVFSKVRHNRIEFVIDALQDGFDVNTQDRYGNTLFHVCAQNNHKKLASAILKAYPNGALGRENKKGMTPVDYADKYGFTVMSAWLRSKAAHVEVSQ